MLILSRVLNEEVVMRFENFTGEVRVTMVDMAKRGRAKLGFTAPKEVDIRRGELGPRPVREPVEMPQ